MLEEGKWVKVNYYDTLWGFVLNSDRDDTTIFLVDGGRAKGIQNYKTWHLRDFDDVRLDERDREELHRLHMNLALDTQDKEWFEELNRYPGGKINNG